tara:strand:+ start:5396 stop:7078 length:1683 start_codon:yes stop_codon:yes gene_type:complete
MKKIYATFMLLFIVGFLQAQEVLVNGGFENWDNTTTPTGFSKAENTEQESTEVRSGTYSAKHTGGTKDIAQTVAIEGGKTYTISLWYKVEAGTGDGTDARIWSNWKSAGSSITDDAASLKGPNNSYLDNNNNAWTNYSVTLTAPATADELYFEVRTYSGAIVYWDDFSVVKEAVANPSLGIDSPSDGDFILGTDVDVSLTVQNFTVGAVGSGADGHIHYTLDGGSNQMKYDTNLISLSGLSYGEHTVTLELVDDSHNSLNPAVTSSLTFTTYKEQTLPIAEDFDYADGVLSNSENWTVFSGTGYDIDVVSGKIEVKHASASGKDLFVSIPTVSGALYYAFDMSLVDPGTGPISGGDYEYFAIFKDDSYNYRARIDVVAPSATGDYTLGISTKGSTADTTWGSDLTYGQSYRVTVMYDQAANIAKLWVDASAETDTSITGNDETDPGTSITQFAFRQSTSSVNETITIDNLNIGQTFNSTLSSDNRLQTINLNIYPNPTKTTLNFSGLNAPVQASVFDMLGKLYIQTEVTNTLDVSALKSGLYMVEIKNETSSKVFKMLKQ